MSRRFLCEALVLLLNETKKALIDGYEVSISGFGKYYVATDECRIYKTNSTRKRTRVLFNPPKEFYSMVNNKEVSHHD